MKHQHLEIQFLKIFGAILDHRQNLFCTAQASDFRANYATISVINNKEVDIYYDLGEEDFGDHPSQTTNSVQGEEAEAETRGAYVKGISSAFQVPLPDMEKSLIGPEVINGRVFYICRSYPSIL